jgi:nicotinamidase/pyrazinamidase
MAGNLKADLVIIDGQNDFCVADDGKGNKGALYVAGAEGDISRVTKMIRRTGKKFRKIHATLDSHQGIGVERPGWWVRVSDGRHPEPFTILGIHPDGRRIVKLDPTNSMKATEEEYTTSKPGLLHKGGINNEGSFGYLKRLAASGRYPHVVWTVHCVVGSWGHSLVPELSAALTAWEQEKFDRVNYIVKGNNPYTEHFSAVKAEVPDPDDISTQINTPFITTLQEADIIYLTGEALSHCLANTGRDIAECFTDQYVSKLVLLKDAASNVTGFDFLGQAFIKDLTAKGMQTATTEEVFA